MINHVIQLTKPRLFESVLKSVDVQEHEAVVRPLYLSICHADQRYYNGLRSAAVLEQKLPMALIHEAVGIVLHDKSGRFSAGDLVVLIPNMPASSKGKSKTKAEQNVYIGSNYCPESTFCSSGTDGFLQEVVVHPSKLLLPILDDSSPLLMVLAEMTSVCVHAIRRFTKYSHGENEVLAVWGDGNIAYILSLLLKYKFPNSKVIVIGKHDEKLAMFSFVDAVYNTERVPNNVEVTHFFECVGGENQAPILNVMLEKILPGGTISVLGVSEQPVAVNIRKMMEKGAIVVGNSRSNELDFAEAMAYLANIRVASHLDMLLNDVKNVRTIQDIHAAFEADQKKAFGKMVMEWNL